MMRRGIVACSVILATGLVLANGDKPKPTPRLVPVWDDAVIEGRVLNLPIMLHRHGFY